MTGNCQSPVAIVGLACRLPGNNNTPEQLWRFLLEGKIADLDPPPSRFNLKGHYDGTQRKLTMHSPGGMFINADPKDIDAGFFGLSQVDASSMDPQQRQLLEVVYEALENAGLTMEGIKSKPYGCFVGSYASDYSDVQTRDPEDRAVSTTIGTGRAMLSNRISHFLDLKGPSMTIDTACSGSLISLDLACRYLDSGDADGAIVAGCNLYMSPEHNMDQSAMIAAASASGRCWTFDARADGYIKAEAINCLVLKRLDDALRDGDPIRAVIRGTSTNSDGWTPGIASPSADAQALAIRRAYERAGITRLEETAYLECHGTGTLAGDPIECRAASSVFSSSRAEASPLRIGSVKSNIGHSEPAAGVSGMLKTVMAVERGVIPGNPTFGIPNPKIDFIASKILPSQATTAWPKAMIRRASVNSFGFGGSNAHVIVEHVNVLVPDNKQRGISSYVSPNDDLFAEDEDENQPRQLFVFSANDDVSLKASVKGLMRHLSDPAVKVDPVDLAYTLSQRRTRHFYRAYVVSEGSDFKESQVVYGKLHESSRIGLVFTGQGAQWPQMGCELLFRYPVAKATVEHLDEILQAIPEPPLWTLMDELVRPRTSDHMRLPQFSQPLVTALQLALLAVFKDFGLQPTMVVGHSSGEIAASVAAGFLSPEDAIKVAYFRGKAAENLQATQSCKLGMLAVGLGPTEIQQYIKLSRSVTVACHNSPNSVSLSGQVEDLKRLQEAIKADGHFARFLVVDLAYHSPYMKEVAESYRTLLFRHCPRLGTKHMPSTNVHFYSTVDGRLRDEHTDAEYWVSNMICPVLFDQCVSAMVQDGGAKHLVEIGPSGALAGPINQVKQAIGQGSESFTYAAALSRGADSTRPLFEVVGTLFFSGVDMNFAKVGGRLPGRQPSEPRVIVDLPNYEWNHSVKYWHESLASKDWRYRPFPIHDLLGTKVLGTPWTTPTFKRTLRLNEVPWIRDHMLGSEIIFPGSAYIAMAVEAVFQMEKASGLETLTDINSVDQASYHLRDVRLLRALVLRENADHQVYMSCYPAQGPAQTWRRFQVSSLKDEVWTEHCVGFVRISLTKPPVPTTAPESLKYPSSAARWYKPFRRVGFNFGPKFQNLTEVEAIAGRREGRARINIPPHEVKESRYAIHPSVIDAFFQSAVPSLYQGCPTLIDKTLVPQSIDEITIDPSRDAAQTVLAETSSHYVNGRREKTQNYKVNAVVRSEISGTLLSEIRGLHFAELDLPESTEASQNIMQLSWQADICHMRDDIDFKRLSESFPEALVLGNGLGLPQPAAFLLSLVIHKFATPSVLDVDMCDDEYADVQMEPEALGTHLRTLHRYSYICKTSHKYANAEKRLAGIPCVDSHIHDTTTARDLPFDDKEKFDMVIVRTVAKEQDSLKPSILAVQNLCSSTGFLVLVLHGTPLDDSGYASSVPSSDEMGARLSRDLNDHEALLQLTGFQIQAKHHICDPAAPGGLAAVYLCSTLPPRASDADSVQFPVVDLSSGSSDECSALVETLRGLRWTGEVTDLSSANTLSTDGPILLVDNPSAPILANLSTETEWNGLRNLLMSHRQLLWLTSGSQMSVPSPSNALVHGFLRSLRGEDPTSVLKTLDLSSFQGPYAGQATVRAMEDLAHEDSREHPRIASENEYCEQDGVIYVSRVLPEEPAVKKTVSSTKIKELEDMWFRHNPNTVRLFCEKIGAMGSLNFNELPNEAVGDGEVEVEVHAAGVNFKDIATSLGLVPEDEHRLGYESSGTITRVGKSATAYKVGDRVGYLRKGSFANRVRVPKENLFLLPNGMTFEEAATIPIVFFTAVYSLMELARVKKGQSVLIHSAAGGVGLASIQLCHHLGAEVFATVGTEEKRKLLIDQYAIPTERIFSSRTTEFAHGIRRLTNGRGVDFVLNSLTGELLDESWRLLADNGMLLEIGKKDIVNRLSLPMEPFDRNCSYHGIDIVKPSISDDLLLVERMVQTIRSLLVEGRIKPLTPMKTFSFRQIPDALRYMRPGEHLGKIVISDGDDDDFKVPVRRAAPSLAFHPDHAYLLVGGVKGLCGSLAVYMARNGARNLVVMSRSGLEEGDDRSEQVVRDLTSLGVTVQFEKGDVSHLQDVERIFKDSKAPIMGVVQGSMVLRDKTLEAMSLQEYHEALACKVAGTWNLHHAAAEASQGRKLEFFTMLSSISGIIGTASQANYAAGNSFQDAFALHRHSLGLSAHSINLGIVEDVGYMSEHQGLTERVSSRSGLESINERQVHEMLKMSILRQTLGEASCATQMITGLPFPLTSDSPLASDMRFHSLLLPQHSQDKASGRVSDGDRDGIQAFRAMMQACLPKEKLVDEACQIINKLLVHTLGLVADVEESKPLSTYGIDSLAAVDLRNWFKVRVEVEITTFDVLSAPNLRDLGKKVVEKALEAASS